MTTTELQSLERQVLSWIEEERRPVSTTELLEKHQKQPTQLSGETLRRVVWNLVDQGLVAYDHSWRLSPSGKGGR